MQQEKTAKPNIWREEYRIRSYEVNAEGRLSVLTLFNLLQDAASGHAAALGVSLHQLQAENLTWVLSRLHLRIEKFPRWRDILEVHTWPSGAERLFAMRDFRLVDGSGSTIGTAVSAWLVIQTDSRRPVRIAPILERLNPVEAGHVIEDPLEKLPPLGSPEHERRIRVRYRDLDINQHVNNVSYIEWAVESIPRERSTLAALSGLEISFLAEAFLDEAVIAGCSAQNKGQTVFLHSIRQETTGRELARVRTTWKVS